MFEEDLSVQEKFYPYKLSYKEVFHAILIVGLIITPYILHVGTNISLSSLFSKYPSIVALLAIGVGGYLLTVMSKGYGLYIELKAYRDIYETLRWGYLKDVFLDKLFYFIQLSKFKGGLSDIFYSGPKNPLFIKAMNTSEALNKPLKAEIDGILLEDLTLHRIYKISTSQKLGSIDVLAKNGKEYECEAKISLRFKFIDDRE